VRSAPQARVCGAGTPARWPFLCCEPAGKSARSTYSTIDFQYKSKEKKELHLAV